MRLIDADDLKEIAHEMIEEDPEAFNGGYSYNAVTVDEIDNAPTIDAAPVVRGENLKAEWLSLFECSVCHWECWDSVPCDSEAFNFCPNCGARMDGKKNEEVPVIVVRCKDCKHWGIGILGETDHVKCCMFAKYMVGENGYCVYGEKGGAE